MPSSCMTTMAAMRGFHMSDPSQSDGGALLPSIVCRGVESEGRRGVKSRRGKQSHSLTALLRERSKGALKPKLPDTRPSTPLQLTGMQP